MGAFARCLGLAMLATGLLGAAAAEDKVDVRVVSYAELGETIRQLKGKVVVVDFWADY